MTVVSGETVRVWVTDVWDVVSLQVAPDWTVARLKREALRAATGRDPDPREYRVKLRGAAVLDEQVTLAALRVGDGAPFIVIPARRRPVR